MERPSIGLILAIGLALVRTGASQVQNDFKDNLKTWRVLSLRLDFGHEAACSVY